MTKESEAIFDILMHVADPVMEKDVAVFTIQSRKQRDPVVFRQKLTAVERKKWRLE